MEQQLSAQEGVREKKRRETHRRITEIGLRLFAENGYEATTLDAIAEESGIARRTFFHYFRSKEEIILAWQSTRPDELYAEILKQGKERSPLDTVHAALIAQAADMQPDVAIMIGRIVQSSEQLRVGNQAKFLQMEQATHEALCELWPDAARRDGLRLIAMVAIGTTRLAIDAWVSGEGKRSLADHLREKIGLLETELSVS